MVAYYFDATKGETPATLAQKRAVARALLQGQRSPQNVGEGISALGDGIVARVLSDRADAAEQAGMASANDAFAPIIAALGGGEFPAAPAAPSGPRAPSVSTMDPLQTEAATGVVPSGSAANPVFDAFMNTVRAGGVTNPYALAAIASTGSRESGFKAGNASRTWNDPSQSGQAGTAGGIMSWRDDRLRKLNEFSGGDLSPEMQAKFFLQEDPALIQALSGAKSIEEAQTLMNNAWRFAGYDQPSRESAARLSAAKQYLPQFQGSAAGALEKMAANPASGDFIRYANENAIRSQPLNDKLVSALSYLPKMGVTMEVFSGGQAAKGSGGKRTGSVRHDHGNAADVFFYKDGKKLDWANPQDRPIFEEIVRRGRQAGITGFGAGDGYMRPGSMHLGFGNEAVWGAGGDGENAPAWLRAAFEGKGGTQVASLDPAAGLPPATAPAPRAAAPMERVAQALTGAQTDALPEMAGNGGGGAMPSIAQLLAAGSNPFMSEGNQKIINMLMEQELQRRDPSYQMGLEKSRIELDNLRNPRMSPSEQANYDLNVQKFGAENDQRMFEREFKGKEFGLNERKFTSEDADRTADNAREDRRLEIQQLEYLLKTEPDFYAKYVQQEEAAGRQPLGILDYTKQLKQAGASNTTVTVGGEPNDSALRKKLDEKTGELWSSYQQTGATSAAMGQDMQILDELIKVAPQGPVTGRLAEMFPGVSSAGDAFQAIVKRIAPTLRAPGSGATSDIEYDGMLKSLPALRNKPEANMAISQIIKAKAALNVERSGVIDAYGRGELSAGDARARISEIDKRSIMTPELRRSLEGVGVVDEPAPQGVDPEDWKYLTPEERKLFQ